MEQLDPLTNKTQTHITVCRVVITAEENTAGKADMGIWRGVVQIQSIREALSGKVTLEQGPRQVVKTQDTWRQPSWQKTGPCEGLKAGAALDSQPPRLAHGTGHLQTKPLAGTLTSQNAPSRHL